jgi:hypothetical protein
LLDDISEGRNHAQRIAPRVTKHFHFPLFFPFLSSLTLYSFPSFPSLS